MEVAIVSLIPEGDGGVGLEPIPTTEKMLCVFPNFFSLFQVNTENAEDEIREAFKVFDGVSITHFVPLTSACSTCQREKV